MKLSGKQPRLLPDVMQAIVDLKENKGSTQNKILEHIQNVINAKKITPRPRNITMQVRRALKHGVQNGLLTQKSGKFQLGMRPKDFAVYKIFRHMEPLSGCGKCKKGRGRGRRGRRRRRRRRRRSLGENKSGTDIETPEPMDAGRRRRRRGRRRRRRRGRRRSFVLNDKEFSSGTDHIVGSHGSSKELMCHNNEINSHDQNSHHGDYQYDCIGRASQDHFGDSYVN